MFSVPLKAIVVSLVIHALWGGNPIAAKYGLEVFPPFWSAFIRFVFGVATVAAWCHYQGIRIVPTADEWKPIAQISILFTVQIAVMNFGFDQTSGVNAAILISTNPLFAALFAHFMIKSDPLSWIRTLGLSVAFFGVCLTLLRFDSAYAPLKFGSLGDWLCLASAALLGYRLIVSAKAMRRLDPYRLVLWSMIFSLPIYAVAGFTLETIRWDAMSANVILGLVYQGVIVAGVGFMVSLKLISLYRASTMTSFNFVSPVTGVLLAWWLLNEPIYLHSLAGVVLLAIGMVLITLRSKSAD